MVEYIERDKAIKAITSAYDEVLGVGDAVEILDGIPAVELVPVVRGEWLPIIEGNEFGETYQVGATCSNCGETLQFEPNYCPHCGAKMYY